MDFRYEEHVELVFRVSNVLYNYLFKTLYTGYNRDFKMVVCMQMFIITVIVREIERACYIYVQ